MRKQCVPGVSPPPSQTPGYEAKRVSKSDLVNVCVRRFTDGLNKAGSRRHLVLILYKAYNETSLNGRPGVHAEGLQTS